MEFTGERMVPGKTSIRIEKDHFERYIFASKFTKEKRVLDIACGVGYGAQILIETGKAKQVDAVDLSFDAISYANKYYKNKKINFIVDDILTYTSKKPYDVIVCFETIEHVNLYNRALHNLFNNLSDNGILIISSPNREIVSPNNISINSKPNNIYHHHEFTIEELKIELLSLSYRINSNDIYGQRLCNESEKYDELHDVKNDKSPVVSSIQNQIPRYFIIIAYKQK